jgi:hypothetical protein
MESENSPYKPSNGSNGALDAKAFLGKVIGDGSYSELRNEESHSKATRFSLGIQRHSPINIGAVVSLNLKLT